MRAIAGAVGRVARVGAAAHDVAAPCLAYLARGKGFANEDSIAAGTLLRDDQLTFDCTEDAQLILAHLKD